MAAGDFTPNRIGQQNQAGSVRELFPIHFSAEVMATFELENVFMPLHRVRTIPNGKSANFPVLGTTAAGTHTPGAVLAGNPISHTQRTLTVDDLVQANVSVGYIDELFNHFDVRGPYAAELGRALSNLFDNRLARVIARAARSPSTLDTSKTGIDAKRVYGGVSGAIGDGSGSGGTLQASVGQGQSATECAALQVSSWSMANFLASLWKTQEYMDKRGVSKSGRYIAMAPAEYYLLVTAPVSTSPLNRDIGGTGSYADASLPRIGSAKIVVTNNMPTTAVTADTTSATGGNNYNGDFTKTKALAWQNEAVGTLKLADITTEMEYSVARQATILVSKYVMGSGVLRPECACEVTTGAIVGVGTGTSNTLLPTA